jgi:hypothetical protein
MKYLRIPVTAAQKQLIAKAMAVDGREFAGWARNLILEAVHEILAHPKRRKAKVKG